MSTSDGDKSVPGGGPKMQGAETLSVSGTAVGTAGVGGSVTGTVSASTATANAYPIDMVSASKVLVRPTEKTNMPTTYRINNSAGNQMRVVIPSSATPQAFYRQAINLKQDTGTNRSQITALPARTVTQTSITVSRAQTPSTYHVPARVPQTVASIQGPRATITTPIRIPTPPISANLHTYVRQPVPSRTSSPSATIISQGTTTWMPNVQVQVPTQLIRANSITQAPRARVVAQTIPANQSSGGINNATITANVVAHQATTQSNQQNVSISSGGGNQSQAFVATLATAVLPPQRQITSTLVYTNNSAQQPYASGTNPQRLTLATALPQQRPTGVRPIQRLPTTNIGVRVSAGSISIRPPSVSVLAPTTVLTTIASGGTQNRTTTVSTANISNTIPARIIQVQNPQSGQVISGGRLPTNLLNIQPLIVNNRIPHSSIQPSLTIAQVGKLTPVAAAQLSGSSGTGTSSQEALSSGGGSGTTTLQTASGQQIVVSSSQVGSNAGSGSATIITGNLIQSNQTTGGVGQTQGQGQITQIVNVAPSSIGGSGQGPQIVTVSQGQVIGTPQTISVANSAAGGGSTTVIPIPSGITGGRTASIPVSVATLSTGGGQNLISIGSGGSTITGIVRTTTIGAGSVSGTSTSTMPSILPIAKVTPQLSSLSTIEAVNSSAPYSVSGTGTSLYIQTRPQLPSAVVSTVSNTGKSGALNVVSGSSSGSIGNSATTFLPTSTFYYERVTASPASSSQQTVSSAPGLSQSISALTSATITTTSAISGPVFSISSSSLSSNSSSVGANSISGAIVTGGQINSSSVITTTVSSLPPYASTTGSFAIVQTGSGRSGTSGPIHGLVSSATGAVSSQSIPQQSSQSQQSTNSSIQAVPVRFHPQLLVDGGQTQQIIVTGTSSNTGTSGQTQQHMLIPVNAAGKLESPQSSILRKRGLESTPIKTGKDLTQTLIAMGKERAREIEQQRERERERELSPPSRPASTDGSTTVSATSSPGADQQEQEEIKAMAFVNRNANSDLNFKSVHEEIFSHTGQQQSGQTHLSVLDSSKQQGVASAFSLHSSVHNQNAATSVSASGSNGNYEQSPRKKPRKQNVAEGLKSVANSLQFFANSDIEGSYRMDTSGPPNTVFNEGSMTHQTAVQQTLALLKNKVSGTGKHATVVVNNVISGNSTKLDVAQESAVSGKESTSTGKDASSNRKVRNVSLLESYKQSWKAANNHFQRYTDVKQREERRPTIVDISNQSHVLQKVNGWKIYHLSAQIEDLCELESQAYDKLDQMLKCMEATPKPSPEIERINELLKGNMQRSKIIIDGINEARTQIMKIFDHKTHVSDIIQRCASKRNFKKREKT
ncbi:histone deacetylase complex subunit SAP130-A [Wyeomyia smithii]|uniref:histone deacetylase complex subunit SAP130-A n=1 Tax=Wyeomyia smithii TaxID=174621 RepID=UPI0024680FBE|nr:histone deacetylase complex subunit SAP130-A [Wyeomyia smithii]